MGITWRKGGADPPLWWKPHLRVWLPLQEWRQRPKPVKR